MTVTLSHTVEEQIRHWIDTGRYPDADAVMLKALEALEAQEPARFLETRELILAGFASGNYRELTPELTDEMERRAQERFGRGEKPSPHVCP
jgi:putative addiction module CopG family antidote